MWILIFILQFFQTQSIEFAKILVSGPTFVWNSNLDRCLTSVTSFNCEHNGFKTIHNRKECEQATDSFLGSIVSPRIISHNKRWKSSPGCSYGYLKSYYNRRKKSYYDTSGHFERGEGHCSKHYPCICLTTLRSCPEEVVFTNKTALGKKTVIEEEDITGLNITGLNITNTSDISPNNGTHLQSSRPIPTSNLRGSVPMLKSHGTPQPFYYCPNDFIYQFMNLKWWWNRGKWEWEWEWVEVKIGACSKAWFDENVHEEKSSTQKLYRKTTDVTQDTVLKWLKETTDISQSYTAYTTPVSITWWKKITCRYPNPWHEWCQNSERSTKTVLEKKTMPIKDHLQNLLGGNDYEGEWPGAQLLIYGISQDNKFVTFNQKKGFWKGKNRYSWPQYGGWEQYKYTAYDNTDLKTEFIKKITYETEKPLEKGKLCEARNVSNIFSWKGIIEQITKNGKIDGFNLDYCRCDSGEIKKVGDPNPCSDEPACQPIGIIPPKYQKNIQSCIYKKTTIQNPYVIKIQEIDVFKCKQYKYFRYGIVKRKCVKIEQREQKHKYQYLDNAFVDRDAGRVVIKNYGLTPMSDNQFYPKCLPFRIYQQCWCGLVLLNKNSKYCWDNDAGIMTPTNVVPNNKALKSAITTVLKDGESGEGYDWNQWDVSEVTDMSYMFANTQFNGDISKWDVAKVTNMDYMFETKFNGDLSKWKQDIKVIDIDRCWQ
jgi:surface protein